MNHIVIDIETLGRRNDAAITQIGAVVANSDFEETYSMFIGIDPSKWNTCNRTFTGETLLWWMEQKNSPKSNMLPDVWLEDYSQALQSLDELFEKYSSDDTLLWTKGSMDLFCLKDLYEYFGMDTPWKFWQPRDIRTAKEFVKDWKTFESNSHNALEDALNELKELKANLK